MDDGAEAFIERMGILFTQLGAARSAGRIAGFLIISPKPQSLNDIAAALGISKASASTNTRVLETYGMIEKVGVRGDRKTYYQTVDDFWRTVLHASTAGKVQILVELFRDGQRLVDKENTVAQARLARLERTYSQFQAKLAAWAEELRKEQHR